jgi:hypothetical protein
MGAPIIEELVKITSTFSHDGAVSYLLNVPGRLTTKQR